MATPNYGYEKRQRDLAKKQKNEEKRLRKLEQKDAPAVAAAPYSAPYADSPLTPNAASAPTAVAAAAATEPTVAPAPANLAA